MIIIKLITLMFLAFTPEFQVGAAPVKWLLVMTD